MENFVDLHTDYLMTSSSYTTGMASLLSIKHDRATRKLSKGNYDSKFLWNKARPYVEEPARSKETVVLGFDDPIQEGPYTDGSELNSWHYGHVFGRSVKGVNFLTALVEVGGMRIPCGVEFVGKGLWATGPRTGEQRRGSSVAKNELFRGMLRECHGKFLFDHALADIWLSSVGTMTCCKQGLGQGLTMAPKSDRKVALPEQGRDNNKYVGIGTLRPGRQTVEVWPKGLDLTLLLTRQVLKNEHGTVGELYLACSDPGLSYGRTTTIHKKRWGVEEFHRSIESNTGSAKSPTRTVRTRMDPYVLSIMAYIKLEWPRQRAKKNHFAMKAQMYLAAQRTAYAELKKLSTPRAA